MTLLLGEEIQKLGAAVIPEGLSDSQRISSAVDQAALITFRLMTACACALSLAAAVIGWFSIDPNEHLRRDPEKPVEILPG